MSIQSNAVSSSYNFVRPVVWEQTGAEHWRQKLIITNVSVDNDTNLTNSGWWRSVGDRRADGGGGEFLQTIKLSVVAPATRRRWRRALAGSAVTTGRRGQCSTL